MKYKKFLLIPVLIFIYIFFIVDLLVNYNPTIFSTTPEPSGGGQPIGIGEGISVVVTRPYFFGLIRLPVYTNYIGYIGSYHQAFFYFIGILTVVFIILEFFVEISWGKGVGGEGEITEWRDKKMEKSWRMKALAKAIGVGIAFGFIVYILSGDAGVSVGLGLLLMYLEYKLK